MEEDRLHNGDHSNVRVHRALPATPTAQEQDFLIHSTLASHPASASNPQHICVVTETYLPEINGVALTLSNLVKGLIARGHTVSVVHPKAVNPSASSDQGQSCCPEAIQVRGLPLPGYHGLQFGVPAQQLLRRHWTSHPPAVVYVATEGPLGWSAVRAARRLDIPIVSGFHTNFDRYCKYYGVGSLQYLALKYLRWFHNQTDCTVVSNEDLRSRLQGAGFKNVAILDRGVDSQLFNPRRRCADLRAEWKVSEHDPVLIYVGRIAAEKNLSVTIEAYRELKRTNDRIKFVVVGDGPLRRALQTEHPDLIFAGMRTGEQLARYYASADVFLFPSETETFGNVTLEAMASGLGVIAYNYACAKLHITDGETGVLVPLGDTKAFITRACSLISEPQALKRIRRQAREYVTYLNWPRVVEKFEALLMSAGGQRRSEFGSPITRRGLAT
jgi:glycosyltransferase involved in cell wall biosynthesis